MTNEEAIRYFKRHIDLYCVDGISREAEEMAIQALSQEPCDDAISRQAVLDGIAEWIVDGYADSEADCSHISSLVTHLPPVTQKSGKWEDLHRCWVCSECGQQTHIEHKYCPNCGCRMVEPQESEDN